jgi:hypothetical protein
MDDDRMDLSSLDPGRDPERFDRMVRSVLARAEASGPHALAAALVARGRVAVLVAGLLAALAWIPAVAGRRNTVPDPSPTDAVATVAGWAEAGGIPSGADVYHVLGVNDVR